MHYENTLFKWLILLLFLNGWEKLVKTFLHIVVQEVTNNNRKKEFLLYCRLFQLQWKYVVFMCRIFVHYLSKIFVFAGTCNCILFPQKYNYFQNDDLIRKKKIPEIIICDAGPTPEVAKKHLALVPGFKRFILLGLYNSGQVLFMDFIVLFLYT